MELMVQEEKDRSLVQKTESNRERIRLENAIKAIEKTQKHQQVKANHEKLQLINKIDDLEK